MPLIRTRQALEEVEGKFRHGERGWGNMKLRSYHLQPYQYDIIDFLADKNGKSKADVVRDLIDEWLESQLKREDLA